MQLFRVTIGIAVEDHVTGDQMWDLLSKDILSEEEYLGESIRSKTYTQANVELVRHATEYNTEDLNVYETMCKEVTDVAGATFISSEVDNGIAKVRNMLDAYIRELRAGAYGDLPETTEEFVHDFGTFLREEVEN